MARTGAKKATMREDNYREYLAHILERHPTAGREELFTIFRQGLGGNFARYQESVDRYAFDNGLAALEETSSRRTKTKLKVVATVSAEQIERERTKAREASMSRLTEMAPILFMKLPTPFGKPLGELTGKEGRKLTGALAGFFKGVPDGKRLCDVRSEAGLREIWAKL